MPTLEIPDELIPALREILASDRENTQDILRDEFGLDPWQVVDDFKERRLDKGLLREVKDRNARKEAREAALRLAVGEIILLRTGGIPGEESAERREDTER